MATSAQEQIELLGDLEKFLRTFQQALEFASAAYRQQVHGLDSEMLQEVHQRYVDKQLNEAIKMINALQRLIEDESVPAIRRRVDQLQHILADKG